MRHVRIDPTEGPSEKVAPSTDGGCVRDQMSRPAVTVAASAPLGEARRLMAVNRIHYLPVVDARGTLVGMVNADDVQETRRAERSRADAVAAVMRAPAVSVGPAMPLKEAMRLMATQSIGALPVVEDGQVIGILTQSDIVTAFARQKV